MARVIYTPQAQRNLDDIFDYIACQNHRISAAARVLRDIDQKCRLYSRFPLASESREDLAPGVQYFSVFKFGEETFKMANVNYFFVHDNRWANVHISVTEPIAEDAKIITAFDNSLQYKKKSR